MRIIVSGPAAVFDESGFEIRDWTALSRFHNLSSAHELIAEHLDSVLLEIRGGQSFLRLDHDRRLLRVHTEFQSPRKLSANELELLVQFTHAQWSDGISDEQFSIVRATGRVSLYPIPYDETLIRVAQIQDTVGVRIIDLCKLLRSGVMDWVKGAINRQRKWGVTLLMRAAQSGDLEKVRYLIDRKAKVHIRREGGATCLTIAAMSGHPEIAELLLEAGANPDAADDEGLTPLIWAANRGHIKVISILLKYGANRNATDITGRNALYRAHGLDVVEHLLCAGVDPCTRDMFGKSAADEAREQADGFRMMKHCPHPDRVTLEKKKAVLIDSACVAKQVAIPP